MEKVPELCIEHLVAKPFAAELYVLTSASGGAMEAVTEAVERVWPQPRRDETDSPAPRVTSQGKYKDKKERTGLLEGGELASRGWLTERGLCVQDLVCAGTEGW